MAMDFSQWYDLARAARKDASPEEMARYAKEKVSQARMAGTKIYPRHNWTVHESHINSGEWTFDELIGIGAKVSSARGDKHTLQVGPVLEYLLSHEYTSAEAVKAARMDMNTLTYYQTTKCWYLKYNMGEKVLVGLANYLADLIAEWQSGTVIRLDENGFAMEFFKRWLVTERPAPEALPVSFTERTKIGWE